MRACDSVGDSLCVFEIDIATISEDTDGCTSNDAIVVEFNRDEKCSFSITDEWKFVVPVYANSDHVYNPSRHLVLQLTTRKNEQNPFWSEISLPRAKVRI